MTYPRVFFAVIAVAIVGTACDSGPRSAAPEDSVGPQLIPVDSFLLRETEELQIGHARPLAVDPFDGSIYISDTMYKRVVRIDRQGEPIQSYGREGSGPGEFRFNGLVFVLDETTVVVADELTQRLNLFDRESGEFRAQRVFYRDGETTAGLTPPARVGNHLWFASLDPRHRKALTRWNLVEDSVTRLGPVPAAYDESRQGAAPLFANAMLAGSITGWDRYLLRGWAPLGEVFRHDLSGAVVERIHLPAVRRRGVPENVRQLLDETPGMDRLEIASRLRQLHTMPDGKVAFVHHDQEILSTEGPLPIMGAKAWIGVLSSDLTRACVDSPVPASPDVVPTEGFRGDTVFVLDRRIVRETELETWIVAHRIDTSECDWLSVPAAD